MKPYDWCHPNCPDPCTCQEIINKNLLRNAAPENARSQVDSTTDPEPPPLRIYRLCDCPDCEGTGKLPGSPQRSAKRFRCPTCRGEGRTRERLAECPDAESLGPALLALADEGAFEGGCPLGIWHESTWKILPWLASARNLSDAGRDLAAARWHKREEK